MAHNQISQPVKIIRRCVAMNTNQISSTARRAASSKMFKQLILLRLAQTALPHDILDNTIMR
jgi:hypothetical protein